jgi:subtilisin family serine protease
MSKIKMLFPYEEKKIAIGLNSEEKSDWGRTLIRPDAIYIKTMGKGVKVCIIDTGISKNHPDLNGAIADVFNPYEKEFPYDQVGHGCVVPGTYIYTTRFGLSRIEYIYNHLSGKIDRGEDGSIIKFVGDMGINTIAYDKEEKICKSGKLTHVHRLNYNGNLYRVNTGEGDLRLTPWHPIYLGDGTIRRADELKSGDHIIVSCNFPCDLELNHVIDEKIAFQYGKELNEEEILNSGIIDDISLSGRKIILAFASGYASVHGVIEDGRTFLKSSEAVRDKIANLFKLIGVRVKYINDGIEVGNIFNFTERREVRINNISIEHYDGFLYDLTIEGHHNYYANGFIVSNTHVAGIIGARKNGLGIIGIAPECELYIAKGLDDDGCGEWPKIVACIQWAVKNSVDIINMSLGDTNEPPEFVHEAIRWASSKGILVIAAAGNDLNSTPENPTIEDVAFPARYDECIAVAATDKAGKLAYFSNRGSVLDIVAPGVDIYSTLPPNRYGVLSGSSQASPMIAGVCALLRSYNKAKMTTYKDAIFELQRLTDKDKGLIKIAKDCYIGVPNFANVSVYSMKEPIFKVSQCDNPHKSDIYRKLEKNDWHWNEEGNFVSELI